MKTDKSVSEEEFLAFLRANVSAWADEEKRTIKSAIDHIRSGLEALPLSFSKVIYFVKTTGGEEGKAFYTRDTTVVIPREQLTSNSEALEKAIGHELFHILSRENPELRERLYATIGFCKCPEIEFPAQLKSRKITNPDAPRNDHFICLQADGHEILAVPVLFSSAEKYDVSVAASSFSTSNSNSWSWRKRASLLSRLLSKAANRSYSRLTKSPVFSNKSGTTLST